MQYYLLNVNANPLLAKMLASRIELGDVKNSDAMDEMFR